jgi:hypothetical protein
MKKLLGRVSMTIRLPRPGSNSKGVFDLLSLTNPLLAPLSPQRQLAQMAY